MDNRQTWTEKMNARLNNIDRILNEAEQIVLRIEQTDKLLKLTMAMDARVEKTRKQMEEAGRLYNLARSGDGEETLFDDGYRESHCNALYENSLEATGEFLEAEAMRDWVLSIIN